MSGNNAMVGIDGATVKSLRESKGLTQLYLATVIGVTTDTISRWENKQYPTIKLENAQKLAQALEVEIDSFLAAQDQSQERGETDEQVEDTPSGESDQDSPPVVAGEGEKRIGTGIPPGIIWLLLALVVVGVGGWLVYFQQSAKPETGIVAQRIVPSHIAPGQSFPVYIRVDLGKSGQRAVILKEEVPTGCRVLAVHPKITGSAHNTGELKWIRRISDGGAVFVYTLQAPEIMDSKQGLEFSGTLVLHKGEQKKVTIGGAATIHLAPYHWSDTNRDGRVDDEEIFAVYELYGEEPLVEFDRQLIDDIWAANGYLWNADKNEYRVGR